MNVDSPKIEAGRTWNPVIKTRNPMLIVDSPTGIYVWFETRHIKVVLKDKSGDILFFSLLNLFIYGIRKVYVGSGVPMFIEMKQNATWFNSVAEFG